MAKEAGCGQAFATRPRPTAPVKDDYMEPLTAEDQMGRQSPGRATECGLQTPNKPHMHATRLSKVIVGLLSVLAVFADNRLPGAGQPGALPANVLPPQLEGVGMRRNSATQSIWSLTFIDEQVIRSPLSGVSFIRATGPVKSGLLLLSDAVQRWC